jgi:hypothetical protein
MTDPKQPNDEDLNERIRRAMVHYTFDRPLPAGRTKATAAWRWPSLLAAAAAGAAITLLAVAVVGWPRGGSLGTSSPSPTPIPTAAGESPLLSPEPEPSEVGRLAADRICLADPGEIPVDWREPGETEDAVRDRLRGLLLVHSDQRAHAAMFVYADDRFVIDCLIDRRSDGNSGSRIARGIREDHGGGVEYSSGSASAGGELVDGLARPADMYMTGTAAPGFERVEVLLADGGTVDAWVGDGLWLAWWNEPVDSVEIRGYDSEGNVVTVQHELSAPLPIDD